MKRTVLYYIDYAAPYPGNFIASMQVLIEGVRKKGVDAHCVFPQDARDRSWICGLLDAGVRVSFLPEGMRQRFRLMKGILKEEQVIFVHMHFTDNIKERLILKLAMLLTGRRCPIVVHYHNHYATRNGFVKQSVKKLVIHGDHLVGCGPGVTDSIRAGKFRNDIACIENAVDFTRLNSVRNGYQKRNFLQFGFDYERKGVDVSLEAFERLNRKYSDLTLSISLSSNEAYVRGKIIEKYGRIPDWVKLLAPIDNIVEYYDDACAFLSPSREEGLCYSVIEAAYCRCPVIASDISGLNEIQIPEIIWCRSGDPQDLADRIDALLCMSEEEKNSLGDRLRASAVKHYDLERWKRQMLSYYEERGLM